MRDFVRRHPLLCFYVLALVINLIANLLRLQDPQLGSKVFGAMFSRDMKGDLVTSFSLAMEFPLAWTYYLSPAAPTIAAFLVILAVGGSEGLREWADRLKLWRKVGWRQGLTVWLLSFCALFGIVAILMIVMMGTGASDAVATGFRVYGGAPGAIILSLIYGMFISVGPALEEMGWRGFALPLLLKRYTPLMASVVVGVLWAAWHLPREIPALMAGQVLPVLAKQVPFFIGCIAASIVATFLFFKLGGSVWGGVIAHAIHNELSVNFARAWTESYTLGFFKVDLLWLIELGAAGLVLLLTGARLGAPPEDRHPVPDPQPAYA